MIAEERQAALGDRRLLTRPSAAGAADEEELCAFIRRKLLA
jgi:hypothetical protein